MTPILFLDDGGVISENSRRGPQWQQLAGEFFVPRLGGDPADWRRANRVVAERLFAEFLARVEQNAELDPVAEREREGERWLRGMAAEVGVAAPDDPAACIALAEAANAYITARVNAAYPGVPETIRALHRAGCTLYTASGEHSRDLAGYLSALEVTECFVTLYGPDLVGVPKENPRYYERVFAHAGVNPADALVVDDSEKRLEHASATGARTVLCGPRPPSSAQHQQITSLAGILDLLEIG